jgi:hypothetical protein
MICFLLVAERFFGNCLTRATAGRARSDSWTDGARLAGAVAARALWNDKPFNFLFARAARQPGSTPSVLSAEG